MVNYTHVKVLFIRTNAVNIVGYTQHYTIANFSYFFNYKVSFFIYLEMEIIPKLLALRYCTVACEIGFVDKKKS